MIIKKDKEYEYRQKWNRENQIRLSAKVEIETADLFTDYAKTRGGSIGAALRAYVYACIGKTE